MPLLRNTGASTLPFTNNPTSANSEGRLNQTQNLGNVKKFTPTSWLGFSSDPTGHFNYIDMGALVAIWTDADLMGESDEQFTLAVGVPKEILPTTDRTIPCLVYDGSSLNTPFAGLCIVEVSTQALVFLIADTTTIAGTVIYEDIFSNTGQKGLPAGWFILYPK